MEEKCKLKSFRRNQINAFISTSKVLIFILFYLSDNCDIVGGKVFQIPGASPKQPHELRTLFPASSTRAPTLLILQNRTFVVSASNINPKGFDFSRLHSPQHVQTVKTNSKPVVPLLWANLPHFDTPSFNLQQSDRKLEEDRNQVNTEILFPSQTPNKAKENNERLESRVKVIKSDWDGRDESFGESETFPENVTTETPPELGRRIQLSNRGGDASADTGGISINTSTVPFLEIKVNSGSDLQRGENSFSETMIEELQQSSTTSIPQEQATTASTSTTTTENFMQFERVQQNKSDLEEQQVDETVSRDSSSVSHHSTSNQGSNYQYHYSVSDKDTMDVKSHSESRDDGVVRGQYSVLEPDGYTRIVTYTADSSGFKAQVKRVKMS